MNGPAPFAALLISLAAFAFCVFASTVFKWHPGITGPLTVAPAVALFASAVWLNRSAGSDDGEEEGPE